MTTVGRFAPSPTGRMHLGNVWTALLAWLSVRAKGGRIVLRIEDVDRERCKPEYARLLMDDLARLGLDWDEGPIFQSERGAVYEAALGKLAKRGLTYPCRCTRKELRALASAPQDGDPVEAIYPGLCRQNPPSGSAAPVSIRLKVPARVVGFEDALLGRLEQRLDRDCGDFVLKRGDGMFAYQLAVVVDDGLMGVTEVLRGEDLADSTPRQLYLYSVLDVPPPRFIHVPLLVDEAGVRLSKRQRSADLGGMFEAGVSPEALIGFLAHKAGFIGQTEPIRPAELIPYFRLEALPRGPVVATEAEMERLQTKAGFLTAC